MKIYLIMRCVHRNNDPVWEPYRAFKKEKDAIHFLKSWGINGKIDEIMLEE